MPSKAVFPLNGPSQDPVERDFDLPAPISRSTSWDTTPDTTRILNPDLRFVEADAANGTINAIGPSDFNDYKL